MAKAVSWESNFAEVIAVGNELLIGHTNDTNSTWLAKQLTGHGWRLARVTIVGDSLDAISSGVREALKRGPHMIITVGGLGPTHDDMTLKGLARSLGVPLTLNLKALAMIRKRYREIGKESVLTKYRKKMAMLPKGAEPLPNTVGTAPGVITKVRRTLVVSLPGVPQEMKAIFKGSIIEILQRSGGTRPREAFMKIAGIIESSLAPVLAQVQRRYPDLYFKSHPRGRESGVRSLILLHVYNTSAKGEKRIGEAVSFLAGRLSELG